MNVGGVATVNGCALIGSRPPGMSCEYRVVSPRHITWTIKEGGAVRRVSDQELLDSRTLKVTTKQGTYTDEFICERQASPQPRGGRK